MIVVDTSAFISLATVDTLRLVLDEFDIHTTEAVFDELENTAEYTDIHGDAATNALEIQTQFTLHTVSEPTFETSRIDQGEASCVQLCQELDVDFLLTDDLRALPELQNVTQTQVAISPIILKALVKRDVLETNEARDRLEQLAKNRDWLGRPIYRRAQSLFSD
jgi:predicted nucleic acid-binding protein